MANEHKIDINKRESLGKKRRETIAERRNDSWNILFPKF